MNLMRTLATLFAGAAFALVIVLACNGSPSAADAADPCDCPDAEPPLAGRIVIVENVRNPGTSAFPNAAARCESSPAAGDWILLGGGCHVDDDNDDALVLYSARVTDSDPLGAGYFCEWHNTTQITIDAVSARAVCLVPAESD